MTTTPCWEIGILTEDEDEGRAHCGSTPEGRRLRFGAETFDKRGHEYRDEVHTIAEATSRVSNYMPTSLWVADFSLL